MKTKSQFLILLLVTIFVLGTVLPAQAFYVEVPKNLKNAITALKLSTTDVSKSALSGDQRSISNEPVYKPVLGGDQRAISNEPVYKPVQVDVPSSPTVVAPTAISNEKKDNTNTNKYLREIQKGVKQMERDLKQFNALMQKVEKTGATVTSDIKVKAEKLGVILAKMKAFKSSADLQTFDITEASQIAQELEQYRSGMQKQIQSLRQIKQQVRETEQSVLSFEKQIAKVKSCVPAEVLTKLTTLKTTIATIKNAQTWSEVEKSGLGNMGDLFNSVNDSRGVLEVCAVWPQILKQADKQLVELDKQLAKDKVLVAKLSAQSIDLSLSYSVFENGITKLKAVRAEAVAKMKSGDAQSAINLLKNDFFAQINNLMQGQQTIQSMNNLGGFNSQFVKGLAEAQKQINSLNKQKITTTELVTLLAEIKTKGTEVLALIKQKDANFDTLVSSIEDLNILRTSFNDKMAELTNVTGNILPGMSEQSQFKIMQISAGLNQSIIQSEQNKLGISNEPVYTPAK